MSDRWQWFWFCFFGDALHDWLKKRRPFSRWFTTYGCHPVTIWVQRREETA